MRPKCPKFQCLCNEKRPKTGHFESHGRFYRKSDSRIVYRWRCTSCKKTFSQATGHPCFGQNKRRVNWPLYRLLCSGVSLRRAAKLLRVHRTTVVRKFRFLADQARLNQSKFLKRFEGDVRLTEIQFDDMETFEHTKFKPLSIAIAVSSRRYILGAEVAQMPAKGLLAKRARVKYGFRPDLRPKAWASLFRGLQAIASERVILKSDQNPHYPSPLRKAFPHATHQTVKGLRGCVVGQGELKNTCWDPLFALNHTAAMLRANMNRLFRRTWCTTKKPWGLKDHLAIYIDYHNQVLVG